MVSSPRQCPDVEGKVYGGFLPSKAHDPHQLCVSCQGKTCHQDDRCDECHEWPEKCCKDVAAYAEKLSAQPEKKKERKVVSSSSSSFSGFSPAMLVPLGQLVFHCWCGDFCFIYCCLHCDLCCGWTGCLCCSFVLCSPCHRAASEAETSDGPCGTCPYVGKPRGLVGFREVYAIAGTVFCTTTSACHPSYQSCSRTFVGIGASGGCGIVFTVGGIVIVLLIRAASFLVFSWTLSSPSSICSSGSTA